MQTREPLSRRAFLARSAAAGAALPVLAGPLHAAAAAARAGQDFVVVVNLEGGNDLLNTTVPVQLPTYYDRRPRLNIAPAAALPITGGPAGTARYKLHPALPTLRALYEAGQVAFVQRVGYPDPNLSHFESMDIWSRGWRRTPPADLPGSGWIARYRDRLTDPMSVVGLGVGNRLDFNGGRTAPVTLYRLASFTLKTDWRHYANGLQRLAAARNLQRAPHAGSAAAVAATSLLAGDLVGQVQDALNRYSSTITYPDTLLGERLGDAAVLLQGGFPTRLVYTALAGFDTHADQGALAGRHAELLAQVDGALDAFVRDLKEMGLWERALIVLISEFGRRNYENGNGTDHGEGGQVVVIGNRVRGGFYGGDIDQASVLAENLPYAVDFRSIYQEILGTHLGTDPAPIFPEPLQRNVNLGFLNV
jgi:uncharacterized protein (DUF1501 family)